jgi:hypothetical protein
VVCRGGPVNIVTGVRAVFEPECNMFMLIERDLHIVVLL